MRKRYSNPTDKKKYIQFPEKFNMTFEQFEKSFESNHVFRDLEPKKRLAELKAAFEVATGSKAEEVKEIKKGR